MDADQEAKATRDNYKQFIKTTTRRMRYQLAKKTLRFSVYQKLEIYAVISTILILAASWLNISWLEIPLLINFWILLLIGIAHHYKLFRDEPWLFFSAAVEALLIWSLYKWGMSNFFKIVEANSICMMIFIVRYWQRGEESINCKAYNSHNQAY